MQMYNTQHLQEKWGPILDYDGLDPINCLFTKHLSGANCVSGVPSACGAFGFGSGTVGAIAS